MTQVPMARRVAQALLVLCALLLLWLAVTCDGQWFDRHIFWPQQFFIPADRRIITAFRAGVIFGALFLLLLLWFVPRGAAALRILVALAIAIPAGELIIEWKLHHLIRRDLINAMDSLTSVDPRYGVTLKPSMDRTEVMSGRSVRTITDAERRRISGTRIDPALPSLVFTGESTMLGHGLDYSETFTAILAVRLHLQSVNLSSMAYRTDQSWLRLKDALPGLQHPVAVVGIFMPGLVGRAFAGQRHPLARPSAPGGVELHAPEPPGLLEKSGFYRMWKHLYWPAEAMDEGLASNAAVLRDIAALAKARDIPCIFVVTGQTPQWMLQELFQGLDYVVVDLPQSELLAEGHPNAQGALRIANALEPRLRAAIAPH
jgi:hypothetical protein